jgi:hypothetical protein
MFVTFGNEYDPAARSASANKDSALATHPQSLCSTLEIGRTEFGQNRTWYRASPRYRKFRCEMPDWVVCSRSIGLNSEACIGAFDISNWENPDLMSVEGSRSIRKMIVVDSAKIEDKVSALESGADDFLIRRISSREFLVLLGQSYAFIQVMTSKKFRPLVHCRFIEESWSTHLVTR